MKRGSINILLDNYAKELSPTKQERDEIAYFYDNLKDVFGENNLIQIGSYPRCTAITPIHDLDALYVIGEWDENHTDPSVALTNAKDLIDNELIINGYKVNTSLQNHSIEIILVDEKDNAKTFNIDLVPCYSNGVNEFNLPKYKVPHIVTYSKYNKKMAQQWNPLDKNQWVNSDPRGYIKTSQNINEINSSFRKSVKIVKKWKYDLKCVDERLKLKSFHLEQVLWSYFDENHKLDTVGAMFRLFYELKYILDKPNTIEDRAQPGKYIDDYIAELSYSVKQKIMQARDQILINLENIDETTNAEDLFRVEFYQRSSQEQFIFDNGFLTIIQEELKINKYEIMPNRETRRLILRKKLPKEVQLHFEIDKGKNTAYKYFFKVQNDKNSVKSSEHRGEITQGRTRNDPEHTKYNGVHHVECYGINDNGECVQRDRCYVEVVDGVVL